MVKKYSFKEFLTENVELINSDDSTSNAKIDRITMPMIQRDYAQGRKTHSGKNGQLILNSTGQKFINEVFSTIIHDATDKQLELDFVYGSIITEKEEKNGVTTDVTYFNPLDGQQRLTTLFLMYWFIAGVELNKDERNVLSSILKNFYYKTRTSSTVFCNKLVNELNSSSNDNSINGFIHNFEMAKLLFDANGISPKYQSDSHILLRALLSKYNALTDIKYHITDRKEKENSLKNMLASDPVVRAAFAEWLSLPTEAEIYNKLVDEIAKESPIPVGVNDFDKKLHQLLYKTTDLVDWMQQYRAIRYKDNYISRPSSSYDWIYVYGYSNEIITELIARGWSCENTCNIGEEPNKKDIPYYWSAAGREIDVSKSVCYDGNTVLQRCSVGSEEITLMVGDTIIGTLNYNELVTDGSGVKKFVDDIEKKYNDKKRGGI